MAYNGLMEMQDEPSIDTDKLSYEIFSILETKFLFGYDNSKVWIPRQVPEAPAAVGPKPDDLSPGNQTGESSPTSVSDGDSWPRIRILSIDGGGCSSVRGILACRALVHLERAMREKSNDPNAAIADYFDVVVGTGIGGILAAMLFATRDGARPVFGAEEAWRHLTEQGRWMSNPGGGGFLRRLFRGGGGGGNGLEKFLRETFTGGERALTLKDTLKPVLIPCYDLSTAAPFLFSRADALGSDGYDFRLSEVCRATSAEPGLLDPVPMRSVDGKNRCMGMDGGLVMSNPAAAAITHVLHNRKDFPHVRGVEDLLVLSLGTGQVIEVGGGGLQYENIKGWKARDWAQPVVRITGDATADLVDQAVGMAFGHCRTDNYVRIQANGSDLLRDGAKPDAERSPHNGKKLIQMAEQMLKQKNVESVLFSGKKISERTNFEKLDSFAAKLVMQHHKKCSTTSSQTPLCS